MSPHRLRRDRDQYTYQFTPHQLLAMFGLTLVAFLGVGFRSEANTREVRHIATVTELQLYQQCIINANNARNVNAMLEQNIRSVKANDMLDAREKATRVSNYENSRTTVLDCGVMPRAK